MSLTFNIPFTNKRFFLGVLKTGVLVARKKIGFGFFKASDQFRFQTKTSVLCGVDITFFRWSLLIVLDISEEGIEYEWYK